MHIRELRLNKGWSQGQLAEFSGLSLRTIQRIEKGQSPTMESLKALASVFETDVNSLKPRKPDGEIDESSLTADELKELDHIRQVRKFIRDVLIFAVSVPLILIASSIWNFSSSAGMIIFIWGATLAYDAFDVFDAKDFFGHSWEKRQLEKRLGRKVD